MALLTRVRLSVARLLLVVLALPLCAFGAIQSEYALKSVFLYNFLRFIEWPNAAFESPGDPLVIGVLGNDPFGPLLEETVAGETFHGRNIRIENYRHPREIGRCQLLFVSASESHRLNEILAAVAGRSIVTVGETAEFVERGGMIGLPADRNRVRLVINPNTLRAARLNVSSKLLRVAEIAR